jgi:ABC-type multidrug transport system ATPase subunit
MLSEGKIEYGRETGKVPVETAYKFISMAAPYLELVEEMTATEFLGFHSKFKPLTKKAAEILSLTGLHKAADKQIRYYSSGMKQRLKLGQAIFSDTPVLLLDEPCTNLDAEGFALYKQLISHFCNGKLIIVSSNDKEEYGFCTEGLDINQYK